MQTLVEIQDVFETGLLDTLFLHFHGFVPVFFPSITLTD